MQSTSRQRPDTVRPLDVATGPDGGPLVLTTRGVTAYDRSLVRHGKPYSRHPPDTQESEPDRFPGARIAVGPAGELFVARRSGGLGPASISVHAPRRYADSAVRIIGGRNANLDVVADLVVGRDGSLYALCAAGSGKRRIAVFSPGADGDVAPTRIIEGPGLDGAISLALGPSGEIYVANDRTAEDPVFGSGVITVYAADAAGTATPIRTIAGWSTGLNRPRAIAVAADGTIYVANLDVYTNDHGSVRTFAAQATEGERGVRTLMGRATRSPAPRASRSITRIPSTSSVVSSPGSPCTPPHPPESSTRAHAGRSRDRAARLRMVHRGPALPSQIAVDSAGQLYVSDPMQASGLDAYGPDLGAIRVYRHGADGNEAPIRRIRGGYTRLNGPGGIAIDRQGRLYVANRYATGRGSVTVYDAKADGDVRPSRMLVGPATGLLPPAAVALDRYDTLYVVNAASVTVYAPGCRGECGAGSNHRGILGRTECPEVTTRMTLLAASLTLAIAGLKGADARGPVERPAAPCRPERFMVTGRGILEGVDVFPAATADTSTPPVRSLRGENTTLCRPRDLAVDSRGRLQVMSGDVLSVFTTGARGDARPFTTSTCRRWRSRWTVATTSTSSPERRRRRTVTGPSPSMERGAEGERRPMRTLAGNRTGLLRPLGVAVDAGGSIYATNESSDPVRIFGAGHGGDVAPARYLAGPHTGWARPSGLAFDRHGALYVVNARSRTVTVYSPRSVGDAAAGAHDRASTQRRPLLQLARQPRRRPRHDGSTRRPTMPSASMSKSHSKVLPVRTLLVPQHDGLAVGSTNAVCRESFRPDIGLRPSRGIARAPLRTTVEIPNDHRALSLALGAVDTLYVATSVTQRSGPIGPSRGRIAVPVRTLFRPEHAHRDPRGIAVDRRRAACRERAEAGNQPAIRVDSPRMRHGSSLRKRGGADTLARRRGGRQRVKGLAVVGKSCR